MKFISRSLIVMLSIVFVSTAISDKAFADKKKGWLGIAVATVDDELKEDEAKSLYDKICQLT